MPRKILHIDLDAFFCAVEERDHPTLQGKPFAVGGHPRERGVLSSCSYVARKFGVRSAMPTSRALRLCPGLIVLPARHRVYAQFSEKVMQLLRNLTPFVEQVSIDEAFLDVSDIPESAECIAEQLQKAVNEQLGLPCSIGVATNKLLAKIANDVGKDQAIQRNSTVTDLSKVRPPNAVTVVPTGHEASFLEPLSVQALWGVGPKTADRLHSLGIHTIGDLARYPTHDLVQRFGKIGFELSLHAQGKDESPIVMSHEVKSISQEVTFVEDINDRELLCNTLRHLAEKVGKRMRQNGKYGFTIKLKLRWSDFTTLTRQITLPCPTNQDHQIYTSAVQLLDAELKGGQYVRLIGVGVSNLTSSIRQLSLWDMPIGTGSEEKGKLQQALDALRDRYGNQIVQRGKDLKTKDE